jgi:hypothetical protein
MAEAEPASEVMCVCVCVCVRLVIRENETLQNTPTKAPINII